MGIEPECIEDQKEFSVDTLIDGQMYSISDAALFEGDSRACLFYRVWIKQAFVVKACTSEGLSDLSSLLHNKPVDYIPIRRPREEEMLVKVERGFFSKMFHRNRPIVELDPTQEFAGVKASYGHENAHMLAVHKHQYSTLRKHIPQFIPETRFVMLKRASDSAGIRSFPGMVQKRIFGASLGGEVIDMFSGNAYKEWVPHIPRIAAQLRSIQKSPAKQHIDWNIQNFIVNRDSHHLHYVDCKPSFMIPRYCNSRSYDSVRECIIGRYLGR